MPLFHTTGCAILVCGGLGVGATMLLAPMFDPDVVVDVVARERARFILGVPTMLVALIDAARAKRRRHGFGRTDHVGWLDGGPDLCRQSRDVFGAPVQIVYGQTESSPVITQAWYDDSEADLTQTIGQPVPHTDVSIRDPQTNQVLPIGAQGRSAPAAT
jgi:fatty-acyl-CoA synthase